MSFEFIRESFDNVMDIKRKITDLPIVLISNTFTILDAIDMDEITSTALGELNGKIVEIVVNGCCIIWFILI